jgi:hypothetical protein
MPAEQDLSEVLKGDAVKRIDSSKGDGRRDTQQLNIRLE